MSAIHPTAIITDGATLGANVSVGAYSIIGEHVTLGDDCMVHSHAVIEGRTTLGRNCEVFPFASIGHAPQHLRFEGEPSALEIGDRVVMREHVTMNPGTKGDRMLTTVGSDCYFMMGSHVAHDCIVGDHVIFANNATIGGHVQIESNVMLGGLAAVHQHGRVGAFAFIGGLSAVAHDVIPFGSVVGSRAYLGGLNIIGMKRNGFTREEIHAMREAFTMLFESEDGTLEERLGVVEQKFQGQRGVDMIIRFMREKSGRHYLTPQSAK
jgi:UDP-N-acetylglucosamine acyltransferase